MPIWGLSPYGAMVVLGNQPTAQGGNMPSPTITTADGQPVKLCDPVFDYYSMELGHIASEPDDTGWFFVKHDRTGRREILNGERICSIRHARRMGWLTQPEPGSIEWWQSLTDTEVARELIHARNRRDAFREGRVPDGVQVQVARGIQEQAQRRVARKESR